MKAPEKLLKTIPVRMSESMLRRAKTAAENLAMSEQDTFRLTIAIGLACLEKTGYDIPEQIADKALSK